MTSDQARHDPAGPAGTAGSTPPTGIAVPFSVPPGIAALRRRWDRAAALGARPHVTVLYPFLPAVELRTADRAVLARIAADVPSFEVRFRTVRQFDGVVWIEPEPSDPFRTLTDAVVARWPDWPPYRGQFDVVIPHLTVAESATAPLEAVAEAAMAHVPFTRTATALELWRQDDHGRWHPHWRLRLGRG
jgi:hypothetical protein